MGGGLKKHELFTLSEIKDVLSPLETLDFQAVGKKHPVFSVVIDSRAVDDGSLFIPLPGRFTDGHNFIHDALYRGAVAVVISEDKIKTLREGLVGLLKSKAKTALVVKDPLKALQILGKYYIDKVKPHYRIAITGSNGKTTTKELLASILSLEFKTVANEKNLNSEIGLPLSIFNISQRDTHAVFELATNHPGEMAVLADIFSPNIAVITNIGTAHIGFFGSKREIAKEKRNVFKNFTGNEIAVLFEDEPLLNLLVENMDGKIKTFGPKTTRGYKGYEDLGLDGQLIHWEGLQIRFPLIGYHNLLNALAAITVATEVGVSPESIKMALESAKPLFGRSQVIKNGTVVILDCYNANPDSVSRVISFFKELVWNGRKIVILGPMFELGKQTRESHLKVTAAVLESDFDVVIFYGKEYMEVEDTVRSKFPRSTTDKCEWFEDFNTLKERVASIIRKDDIVLLKGSRGVELERLLPVINDNVV